MQANIPGRRQRWNKAQPAKTITFWIVIGAIALMLILGFSRGGWTAKSTANDMAETSAKRAVPALPASICIAQFNAGDQRTGILEELKGTSSSSHTNFVRDQGWATMLGETEAGNKVASECTKQLILISQ